MKPTHRTAWTLAALVALLIPSHGAAAPPPLRHHVTLWTFGDDATRPGFADAVRALGADSVSASPSQDVAPLKAVGLSWYEDEAAGKGTLGLRESDRQLAWDAFFAERKEPWPTEPARSRPICLRGPAVVKRPEDETRRNAARAMKGAFAISLADEPPMTVRANPIDWCVCDWCTIAFRVEMQGRYGGDLAALNDSWGTQ